MLVFFFWFDGPGFGPAFFFATDECLRLDEYIFLPLLLYLAVACRHPCRRDLALQEDRAMGLLTTNHTGRGINKTAETKSTRPGLNITTTGLQRRTLTKTAGNKFPKSSIGSNESPPPELPLLVSSAGSTI